MLAGGTAQLLRAQFKVDGMRHLSYPLRVLSIVGAWKRVGILERFRGPWLVARTV
ncbi:hypothetical protein E5J99_04505 [Hymenobacter elongatus]|uniref:Uncharacterized protein n=2 Tax=Hymenobacter elongatus TaxID=877208 RepID=A0A4Z0PPC9_9BACT|nr:hypothetical protein E5J99_04505 [Hymenobacter elongatus]